MFDPGDWLTSGQPAVIDGLALKPQAFRGRILSMTFGQAVVYYLRDERQGEWILKKFNPGQSPEAVYILAVQSLVPRESGFESAFQRRCIRRDLVSPSGFSPSEFVDWVDGTLLMPRVIASEWRMLLKAARDGNTELSIAERENIAGRLCAKVAVMERAQLAHRDLSLTNVMLDDAHDVHLIDWDSLYAPSLAMPKNTVVGTYGYIAPFLRDAGPSATWLVGGDRFALAVLILEVFAAEAGCAMSHDGSLLEQTDLNTRGGPTIDRALEAAGRRSGTIQALFVRALFAPMASACPSPEEWARALRPVPEPRPRRPSQAPAGVFVALDPRFFIPLEPTRFTPLLP
jgi:hypothetical protein